MSNTTNKKNSSTSNRKTTTTNKSSKSKTNSKTASSSESNSMRDEIIILILLAFSILMLISIFGYGGVVGGFVSGIIFGLFGLLGYIFPIALFIGVTFFYINREKQRIYVKIGAWIVLWTCVSTLLSLFSPSFDETAKVFANYQYAKEYHTSGGLFGGMYAKLLSPLIGTVGTVVVLVVLIVISGVLISEKSFLKVVSKAGMQAHDNVSRKTEQMNRERLERKIEKEKQDNKYKTVQGVSFDTTLKGDKDSSANTIKGPFEKQDSKSGRPTKNINELFRENPVVKAKVEEPVMNHPVREDIFARMPEVETNTSVQPIEEDAVYTPPEERTRKARSTKDSRKEMEDETVAIEQGIKEKSETKSSYVFPPINLLSPGKDTSSNGQAELRDTAMKLQQTLRNFGVNVQVTDYSRGPSVTRYELQPETGVKVSKIVGLADDIKLNLAAADIRIEAPIPGKAAVGIEVPNKENTTVALRSLLESSEFRSHESNLAFAAGKDIGGKTIVTDIAKMPHVLIAGSTGSGKSVCINTLIMSILYKANPEDVKLIMIDPKVVELSVYNGIPHLLIPVVTDPKKAAGALHWAVTEMTKRYELFAQYNVRDLKGYNEKVKNIEHIEDETKPEKKPQIIVIVDELADLMMVAPGDVEEAICRLAQLARAAGIHLILATQRPSVNVITGLIKANMPSRIAFAVSSGVDSRTIIDMNGAEKLLGKGDMLFYPSGYPKPARVQGAFVSDEDVHKVVEFLIEHQGEAKYSSEVEAHVTSSASGVGNVSGATSGGADELDTYFVDAGKFIIEKDKASIGMLQRMFKIGFNRAARIMDQLCDAGVVGEEEGTKPRKVIMSMEQFEQYIDEYI